MESQALRPLDKIVSLPRKRLPRELLFVVLSYVIYSQVRGLAADRSLDAFANAYQVINLEEKLGVFRELSLQRFVISRGDLIDIFNLIYFYGLFPLLLPTALWLYLRRPRVYDLARNAFLVSGAIAVCFYVLMPTAPPRLVGMGFLDTLGTSLTPKYGSIPGVNHYAAMPSMHVGWNFLLAVAIYLALEGKALRSLVGYMPENDAFISRMSGVRFVRYMAEISGLPPDQAMERAHEAFVYRIRRSALSPGGNVFSRHETTG